MSGAGLDAVLTLLDDEAIVELLSDAVEQYSPSYAEEPAMEVFAARLNASGVRYLRSRYPATARPATTAPTSSSSSDRNPRP